MELSPSLTEKQGIFLQSDKYFTIFQGGLGSGKTRVLCHSAIKSAIAGRVYLLTSFSYTALTDTVFETMIELLETEYKGLPYRSTNSPGRMNIYIGKGKIWLRTGRDPNSLRGPNVNDFGIDEAREFVDDSVLEQLMARARRSKDPRGYIATTPKGKNWVHELAKREDALLIHQTTLENPFLPDGYAEKLLSKYTSKYARQEVYGEIVEMGAGIIDPEWFKISDLTSMGGGCRFWDLAVSISNYADYSAGANVFIDSKNDVYIRDIKRLKMEYPDLKEKIIKTAHEDGTSTIIGVEDAGQQMGFIQDLRRDPRLNGYIIKSMRPQGDKLNRAMPWASRAEAGKVYLYRGEWNKAFLSECSDFSADDSHMHDDQIDSVSGAYSVLTKQPIYYTAKVNL